jgi:hypothetical protein
MALKTILCTKKYLARNSLKIPIECWNHNALQSDMYFIYETGTFQSALLFTSTISEPMTVTWQEEPVPYIETKRKSAKSDCVINS